jgi:hypothetical protein
MDDSLELQAFFFRSVAINSDVDRLEDEGLLAKPDHGAEPHVALNTLKDFSLEARLRAQRMGEVYQLLYCLENSVRELIESTLREALGPDDWWIGGVNEGIRRKSEKRKADDLRARWHSSRGESLVNYVDFPEYGDIITEQWELFEDLLGDAEWVVAYFSEMNRTRRALAHTGDLTQADVDRMELRVRDWLRVVG